MDYPRRSAASSDSHEETYAPTLGIMKMFLVTFTLAKNQITIRNTFEYIMDGIVGDWGGKELNISFCFQ
jgi:hypothetical protein